MHRLIIFIYERLWNQKFAKQRGQKREEKNFLRSLIKSVDTGSNGTLDYIVKKGSGKNKIAKTRQ